MQIVAVADNIPRIKICPNKTFPPLCQSIILLTASRKKLPSFTNEKSCRLVLYSSETL